MFFFSWREWGGGGGRFLAREISRTFRKQLSALFSTVTLYFLLYGTYLCKYQERSGHAVTIVFLNYSNRLTLLAGGFIYDTVASRPDIFLQETTAHDPTTDQRTNRLFCSLACSKLQNSDNRENMNRNLKALSLSAQFHSFCFLGFWFEIWAFSLTESFELAYVQQASVYVA